MDKFVVREGLDDVSGILLDEFLEVIPDAFILRGNLFSRFQFLKKVFRTDATKDVVDINIDTDVTTHNCVPPRLIHRSTHAR